MPWKHGMLGWFPRSWRTRYSSSISSIISCMESKTFIATTWPFKQSRAIYQLTSLLVIGYIKNVGPFIIFRSSFFFQILLDAYRKAVDSSKFPVFMPNVTFALQILCTQMYTHLVPIHLLHVYHWNHFGLAITVFSQ